MRVALIIPAAGSGERLGYGRPKALVDLAGAPLVRRTLERLALAGPFAVTVVLSPRDSLEELEAATRDLPSLGPLVVREGGATRQASVHQGLRALAEHRPDLVCVHDAARPLVAAATVKEVIARAAAAGAATVASRPSDSARIEGEGGVTSALDRARLWLVETPQVFGYRLLLRAHEAAESEGRSATDDAALVEALGVQIQIVESQSRNLKITTAADLATARELLREAGESGPAPR